MCERFPGFLYGGAPVSSWEKRSRMSPIDMAIARGRFSPSVGWQGGGMSEFSGMTGTSGMMGMSGMMVADSSRTNLIVNYLPQNVTEKDLFNLFSGVGPVEYCRIMRDYKTGYSYGFGFVNFVSEKDASNAINNFNGYAIQNKRLKVSYARPSGDEIKETNLYVTNLPRAITELQLETIFGKYGRIVQKHILRDKNSGMPRGVAFVRYDKREEAQEAISALNNVIPDGGTEPLCVKVAEEHGKQKAAYYAGWNAGMHHRALEPPEMFPPPQEMYPPPPIPNFQGFRMPSRPGPNFPVAKRPHPGGPIRKVYSPMQQPFNKSKLAILQQQRYFQGRNNYF